LTSVNQTIGRERDRPGTQTQTEAFMKREIEGRVYDTTLAMLVASQEKTSTHIHRATSLYRSVDGDFFVVEEREAHGVDSELLTPLTEEMAEKWLQEHGKGKIALSRFGDGKVPVTLQLDTALKQRIAADARAKGISDDEWMMSALESVLQAATTAVADGKEIA
jgi:hypothetical protein